jgi:hypothetical protein
MALLPLAVPELPDLERRHERRVSRQDAEFTFRAGHDDLVDLLPDQRAIGRHNLEREFGR